MGKIMDCRRIKLLIPLFVGGDLSEAEAERAREHLRSCADCRSLTAEFEASQKWFRQAEPDFDEGFLRDFKRDVLQDVYKLKRQPRPWWPLAGFFNNRLSLVGSAAALLLFALVAFYALRNTQESGVSNDPQRASIPAKKEGATDKTAEISPDTTARPASDTVRPRRTHHARAKKAAQRQDTTEMITSRVEYLKEDEASEQFIKTEIETSDPNIRIIWLHPKEPEQGQSNPSTDF
jgi:hypothetical protein